MSKIACTVAALIALFGSAAEASCEPKQVDKANLSFPAQVNRVFGWGSGNQHQAFSSWSLHPDWVAGPLKVFKDAGVNDNVLKYMNFAVLNHPLPQDIEYIAIFASGQQVCFGQNQVVTGADGEWRYQINKATGGKSKKSSWTRGLTHIDKRSLAGIFMDGQNKPTSYGLDFRVFDLKKTLVVDILDTSFQYPADLAQSLGELGNCNTGNSLRQNNNLLAGWKAWLDHHVQWENIKGFFGSGFSRGGCFVTRLAHNLFKHSQTLRCNAKLILETFDPVCHTQEWDKEVEYNNLLTNNNVRNPFKNSQKCHQVNTSKLFGDLPRKNIRWLNTIGGEKVVLVANAFCSEHTTNTSQHVQILDNGSVLHVGDVSAGGNAARPFTTDAWYEETWVGQSHGFIGDWHSPQNPGVVPCQGSSRCGTVGNTCSPNVRADKDAVYKHAHHAALWGTESVIAVSPGRYQNNCHVPPTWTPEQSEPATEDAPDVPVEPIFEERTEQFWDEYYNAEEAGSDSIFVAHVNAALAAEKLAFSLAEGSSSD